MLFHRQLFSSNSHWCAFLISQLHTHISFVKNRFSLLERDHPDLRLSPQDLDSQPPMNLGHSLHCALSTIDLRGISINWLKLSFWLSRLYGLTGVCQFALIRLSSILHEQCALRNKLLSLYSEMEIYNSF
jgi:hypothetical protein